MVWQDKLKLLPFLPDNEEKFNKGWHWLDHRWLRKCYLLPMAVTLVIKEALDHITYFSTQ